MNNRPLRIDELTINDHSYLVLGEDECYYFGSFYKDYANNPNNDNSIIHNIKKKPSTKGSPGYEYKDKSIHYVASILEKAVSQKTIDEATFVPVPPSKIKGHDDYDDRMTQILNIAILNKGADIRELIIKKENRESSHTCDIRPKVSEIQDNIKINEDVIDQLRNVIFLVDDVITNGTHFKAIKNILLERFPHLKVKGVFICRRVPSVDNDLLF